MGNVLDIVVLGRAARNTANIKNRQPIARMFTGGYGNTAGCHVCAADRRGTERKGGDLRRGLEGIHYLQRIKPQLKTLGPKYGKLLNAIRNHLSSADGLKIVTAVKEGGTYSFETEGTTVELKEEDLLIEPVQKEGFTVETDKEVSVILDTVLTPQLIEEGFVREIISKVQTMRKEAGFEVTDHILLCICDNEKLIGIVRSNAKEIQGDTLSDQLFENCCIEGYKKDWNINGEDATFCVKKV